MRLIILFFCFCLYVQPSSGLFDFDDFLKPETIDEIKKKIDITNFYNSLGDEIKKVINADRIGEKLKQTIKIEDILKIITNSFKENLNKSENKIKSNESEDFFSQLLTPKIPIQQFFKDKQLYCESVCQSWYNVLCFLVMGCEQKLAYFKEKMTYHAIIIGIVIGCSFGVYLFTIFSEFFEFISWLLSKLKPLLSLSFRYCSLFKSFMKKIFHRNDNQALPEQEIQPPPTAERFIK